MTIKYAILQICFSKVNILSSVTTNSLNELELLGQVIGGWGGCSVIDQLIVIECVYED